MNERQRRFVEAYTGPAAGNAAEAARQAGYQCANNQVAAVKGSQLLRNAEIAAAVKAAQTATRSDAIATRDEQERFLTKAMRDEDQAMTDRLKAADQLAKRHGLYEADKAASKTAAAAEKLAKLRALVIPLVDDDR